MSRTSFHAFSLVSIVLADVTVAVGRSSAFAKALFVTIWFRYSLTGLGSPAISLGTMRAYYKRRIIDYH